MNRKRYFLGFLFNLLVNGNNYSWTLQVVHAKIDGASIHQVAIPRIPNRSPRSTRMGTGRKQNEVQQTGCVSDTRTRAIDIGRWDKLLNFICFYTIHLCQLSTTYMVGTVCTSGPTRTHESSHKLRESYKFIFYSQVSIAIHYTY